MAQLLLSLQTLFAKQKLTHVGSPGRRHFFETGGRSEITERRWKTDTARVVKHLDNTKSRRLLLPMIHYCKDKQDRKLFHGASNESSSPKNEREPIPQPFKKRTRSCQLSILAI